MISTKIVIDASQVTKTFDKIESEAKQTGNVIDNAFKVEVDTSQVNKLFDNVKSKAETIKDSFKNAFDMSSIANFTAGGLLTGGIEKAVGLITEGFTQAIEKGAEFEKQLNAVGAITGQSGEALDKIGQSALELSKQFGGNVNAQLGAFQGILSKFGADLAKTPEALNEVTKNVNLLAKAGGIDATEAMNSLTNVMLQFGVNVSDANEVSQESARFMNVLAASAQVGAAEIPQVAEAILQAGVAAKGAGLSLEETNAAIQRLAVGGKVGSEAGVGLRNVLGLLQKQSGEGDKILEKMGLTTLQLGESLGKNGLAKTLDLVKNGLNAFGSQTEKNQALMQLFGAENSAVAGILLDGTTQINEFTKAMTGTQSGVEQARVNMQGFSETMSRLKASIDAGLIVTFMTVKEVVTTVFDGIMIFLNNTVVPFFENVFGAVKEAFMPLVDEISNLHKEFMNLFSGVSGGFDVLNVLKTIFETLGQVVGLFIQIALQPFLISWRGIIAVNRLVVSGVQSVINYFKQLSSETGLVSSFINTLKDGFFGLVNIIKETIGFIGNLLEKFGLIKKDKPMKEIKEDTKEIKENVEQTTVEVAKQTPVVKTLQEQYDELLKATQKLAQAGNFGTQYEKNIAKLQELKAKLDEITQANQRVELDINMRKGLKEFVNDYFKKEIQNVNELQVQPRDFAVIKPLNIKIPTLEIEADNYEFANFGKDFAKNFVKATQKMKLKIDNSAYKESLKELETQTQSELESTLTMLNAGNVSYEEYAQRRNEILERQKQREIEIEKEKKGSIWNIVNETTAGVFSLFKDRFENNLIMLADYQNKEIEMIKKQEELKKEIAQASADGDQELYNKKNEELNNLNKEIETNATKTSEAINSIYSNMAISMGTALGEALVTGQNGFKALIKMAFDFLDKLIPIWSAQILGFAMATPDAVLSLGATAFAKWSALTILLKSAVAGVRSAIGYKDGVINLQGAGTSRSDSIPAMLSKGESVINAPSTQINEPFLRYANNGGDLNKLFAVSMNTRNLENLIAENNMILQNKNLVSNVNVNNRFEVANSGINVKFKR